MGSFIQNNHVARHYAMSLYGAAKDVRQVAIVKAELTSLRDMLRDDAAFAAWCANPTVARAEKARALVQLAEKAGFSALVSRLLSVMAMNKRLLMIPLLLKAFTMLERADKGEVTVRVTSAHPLSVAQQEQVTSSVAKAFNAPIVVEWLEDHQMVGGIRVACGSVELDASVQGRLRIAEARLAQAIEHTDISQYI